MKRMNLRRNMNATVLIAGTIIAASALANTEDGSSGMMVGNGIGWMGGYGGILLPILLFAVVVGLVVWFAEQN